MSGCFFRIFLAKLAIILAIAALVISHSIFADSIVFADVNQ
jgi:hypothetical protein